MKFLIVLNIFFVVFSVFGEEYHHINLVQQCADFKPQQWVEVDKLLGKWFATEVIYHGIEERNFMSEYNECPVIFLSEVFQDGYIPIPEYNTNRDNINYNRQDYRPNNQDQQINWDELMEPLVKVWRESNTRNKYRKDNKRTTTLPPHEDLENFKKMSLQRLKLIWNESGNKVEYSLRYNDSRPGYWMSFGSQNGSMYDLPSYKQFIGTIQILKAVRTHTVLTFCHITEKTQFFSLVISREPWLNSADVEHIHNMLERKQLPIKHYRKMCMEYKNSSSKTYFQIFNFFTIIVIFVCLNDFLKFR